MEQIIYRLCGVNMFENSNDRYLSRVATCILNIEDFLLAIGFHVHMECGVCRFVKIMLSHSVEIGI